MRVDATGCNLTHRVLKYPRARERVAETTIEYRFCGKRLAVQIARRHVVSSLITQPAPLFISVTLLVIVRERGLSFPRCETANYVVIYAHFRLGNLPRALLGHLDLPIISPIVVGLPPVRRSFKHRCASGDRGLQRKTKRARYREVLNANEIGSINVIPGIYLGRSVALFLRRRFED